MKRIPSIDFTFHCSECDGAKFDIKADSGRDAVRGMAAFILCLASYFDLNAEEIVESINRYVHKISEKGIDIKIKK